MSAEALRGAHPLVSIRIVLEKGSDFVQETQNMYYLYLIQCEDGSIYTGITTDLKRRFKEHSDKVGGHYTRAHKVEKILYAEKYPTRSEALKREMEIKKLRRKEKLKLTEI